MKFVTARYIHMDIDWKVREKCWKKKAKCLHFSTISLQLGNRISDIVLS